MAAQVACLGALSLVERPVGHEAGGVCGCVVVFLRGHFEHVAADAVDAHVVDVALEAVASEVEVLVVGIDHLLQGASSSEDGLYGVGGCAMLHHHVQGGGDGVVGISHVNPFVLGYDEFGGLGDAVDFCGEVPHAVDAEDEGVVAAAVTEDGASTGVFEPHGHGAVASHVEVVGGLCSGLVSAEVEAHLMCGGLLVDLAGDLDVGGVDVAWHDVLVELHHQVVAMVEDAVGG